jgi:hypothetical protein
MKPCPFCGETEDIRYSEPDNQPIYWCGNCGCFGPNDVSEAKARKMWNLRRPAADLLAACEADVPQLADLARMIDPELTDQLMSTVYAAIAKVRGE